MKVYLTFKEIELAATIGIRRYIESRKQNLNKDKYGYNGDIVWDVDIEAAAAEMAFCKSRGIFWGGCINNFKEADVGENIQVRHTKYLTGRLIIREDDSDDESYVLVVGKTPDMYIKGWLFGRNCKYDKWKDAPNNRPPAWFVPQNELIQSDVQIKYLSISNPVQLTDAELEMANVIAFLYRNQHGYDLNYSLKKFSAEIALCKYRNIYWGGELPRNVHIIIVDSSEFTISTNDLNSLDKNHFLAFVTGEIPSFNMIGWCKVEDLKGNCITHTQLKPFKTM